MVHKQVANLPDCLRRYLVHNHAIHSGSYKDSFVFKTINHVPVRHSPMEQFDLSRHDRSEGMVKLRKKLRNHHRRIHKRLKNLKELPPIFIETYILLCRARHRSSY